MNLHRSRVAAMLGLLASLPATATTASAAETTVVQSRSILTQHETLRGTMSFRTPASWRVTPASGVYTARFTVEAGPRCAVEITTYVSGKATRRSATQQVRRSIGAHPAAGGRRPGGVFGVGRTEPSTTSKAWLHGVAVVRVARRRFGWLRMFTSFSGADCSAAAAPEGEVTKAMATVLRHAKSRLRVARGD